jgi:NitT/TauT family transport system permease protein
MTTDIETSMVDASKPAGSVPSLVARAKWKRARFGIAVLATQALVLAALLVVWERATPKGSPAAFMFGSPSAIAGFLVQMAQDGSLWRDAAVTGMETLLGFFMGNEPEMMEQESPFQIER